MQQKEFFERYEIDVKSGRLGGGAFGTVYKAYDHLRDEYKAIKIAEVKIIDGKEFSLISEFNASQAIPLHKNIAHYESVFQFHMPNGLFDYAVMQYYPEGNLKQLLTQKKLQLEEKFSLVNGLLQGLTFLHKNNIIHRDIKPSNILISIDTRHQYVPKIADFGLSKNISDTDFSNITNSFGGGTLDYSSPEQLFGNSLRPNTDLWSFGVIVYEIFMMKRPFDADDATGSPEAKRRKVYQKIVQAVLPANVDLCPAPYNDIIRLCLIKDPSKRVKKGEDLIEFLKNPVPIFIPEEAYSDEETLVMRAGELVDDSFDPIAFFKTKALDVLGKTEKENILTTEEKVLQASEKAKLQRESELRQAEEERIRAEEEKQIRILEEKYKKEAELARIQAEQERKLKEVEDLKKAEAERRRNEEAARQRAAEEEQRRLEAERIQAEAERNYQEEQERVRAEAEKKQKEETQRIKAEEERKRKEEEERQKADVEKRRRQEAEQIQAADERKKQEEQERLRAEEKRLQQEEQERIQAAEAKKRNEEEAQQRAAEKEQRRLVEERIKAAAEKKHQEEQERIQAEEERQYKEATKLARAEETRIRREERRRKFLIWWQLNRKRLVTIMLIIFMVPAGVLITYEIFARNHFSIIYENESAYLAKGNKKISEGYDKITIGADTILAFRSDSTFIYDKKLDIFTYLSPPAIEMPADDSTAEKQEQEAEKIYEGILRLPKEKIDIPLLESFLKKYPASKRKKEVEALLQQMLKEKTENLSEQALYDEIIKTQSPELAQKYLDKYPKGKFTKLVFALIISLKQQQEDGVWTSVSTSPTIASLDAYLMQYPSGRYADMAKKLKKEIEDKREKELAEIQRKEEEERKKKESEKIVQETTEPTKPVGEKTNPEVTAEKIKEDELPEVIKLINKDFISIAGGTHTLGCEDAAKGCDPKMGTKTVQVRPFSISSYEVTQDMYKNVMKTNPSFYNDHKNNPVENLTYKDVESFIKKLNEMPGNPYRFRLPTEAEWEMAALAGGNTLYAGSNTLEEVAVTTSNGTERVGRKKANAKGIFDMSGNVAEWCADDWAELNSAKASSQFKVVKGGSYRDKSSGATIKNRQKAEINRPFTFIGFRLVREIK
jgi:serine/threonine protein kinase/formylglycine-generating enzyme required for sulfatase activity